MRIKFLLALFCILYLPTQAQTFKGTVVDQNGSPISHASIYLHEIKSGILANYEGNFSFHLPVGDYTCEVSCPGYNELTWHLLQSKEGTSHKIMLMRRDYVLPANNVADKLAEQIIRSTINAAPHYRSILKSYKADVYSLNKEKLIKVPGLQKISKAVRYLADNYKDVLVVDEEHTSMEYHYPYRYDIHTISKTTELPDELDAKIDINTTNLYDGMIFGKLSPIAPKAMKYYRYKLICTTFSNGQKIYKIQVIPRNQESILVSGYLNIIDGLWSISSFDILIYDRHVIANIKSTCKEIVPKAFMPITIQADVNYHNTGFQALSHNIHSINYSNIKFNNDSVMSRLPGFEKGTHHCERYLPKDLISFTVDSGALNRDSLMWDSVRRTPLIQEEIVSYQHERKVPAMKKFHFSMKDWSDLRTWWNLFTKGDRFTTPNGKQWMDCYSLTSIVPEFNFVDGVWIGYKFGFGWRISHNNTLEFRPAVYYTTARKKWITFGDVSFTYAPRARGKIMFKGESTTEDFNEETGESRMFNAVSALIYADNYVKLFKKEFLSLSNQIEPFNGMLFTSTLSWERRSQLENSVHHSLLGGKAEANIPRAGTWHPMPLNKLLKMTLTFEYTPAHYYHMEDDKKVYEPTENPTFTFSYSRAFRISEKIASPQYNKIQVGVSQTIKAGLFNRFVWIADAGLFYHRSEMEFPDYHHFPTVQNTSSKRPFSYGFFLLDCYTFSTTDRWVMLNTSWYTPFLALKYLPFFKRKKFDEALHARFLATPEECPYAEFSYSLGVEDIARVGCRMGFDRHGYRSVGISLSLNL